MIPANIGNILAVHMSVIAIRLYSEELIPKATYQNTITSNMAGHDKANSLLLTLKATIDAQPQLMKTLIEAKYQKQSYCFHFIIQLLLA